jgi:hypothetical protein
LATVSTSILQATIAEKTTNETTSFHDVMRMYNQSSLDILKMDIEGQEFSRLLIYLFDYFIGTEMVIVDQLLDYTICQILIELHAQPHATVQMLQKISRRGFHLFSTEQHPLAPGVKEYSFIHQRCMEQYGAVLIAKYLD